MISGNHDSENEGDGHVGMVLGQSERSEGSSTGTGLIDMAAVRLAQFSLVSEC